MGEEISSPAVFLPISELLVEMQHDRKVTPQVQVELVCAVLQLPEWNKVP